MSYDDTAKFELQSAKLKRDKVEALDGANGRSQKSPARTIVRIRSFRVNILDEDNFYGGCKALLDSLRYAGLLHNDSKKDIEFIPTQIKVAHRKDEKTLVEIEYA